MLPKQQRLTKKEFDHVFAHGKRIHSPTLQLIYVQQGSFHGAVVVGKKVCKKAVGRNMIRRRLYGALYRHQKTNELQGVYILIAKPALLQVSRAQLSDEVVAVLSRI